MSIETNGLQEKFEAYGDAKMQRRLNMAENVCKTARLYVTHGNSTPCYWMDELIDDLNKWEKEYLNNRKEPKAKLNGDYSEEKTNTLLCGKCGGSNLMLSFDCDDTIAISYECMDCGKRHFVCAIRQERRGADGHETT